MCICIKIYIDVFVHFIILIFFYSSTPYLYYNSLVFIFLDMLFTNEHYIKYSFTQYKFFLLAMFIYLLFWYKYLL